jgi:DNA polymerase-3 subunit alpha
MMNEYEAVGFYLSAHPLDGCGAALARLGVTPLDRLAEAIGRGQQRLRVGGVVLSKQERGAAGQRLAFIRLSDTSGSQEVAIFRDVYAEVRELIEPGRSVLITASARLDAGAVKVTAQTVEDLAPRLSGQMARLAVHLHDVAPLGRLAEIMAGAEAGRGRVSLVILCGPDEVVLDLPKPVALSPAIRAEIAALPGVLTVADA